MKATLSFHKIHIVRQAVEKIVQSEERVVGVDDTILLCRPALMKSWALEIACVAVSIMLSNAFAEPVVRKRIVLWAFKASVNRALIVFCHWSWASYLCDTKLSLRSPGRRRRSSLMAPNLHPAYTSGPSFGPQSHLRVHYTLRVGQGRNCPCSHPFPSRPFQRGPHAHVHAHRCALD